MFNNKILNVALLVGLSMGLSACDSGESKDSPKTASTSEWLTGVYVNQDKNSSMDEVVFCDAGKAYAGMGHREYQISKQDGHDIVVLQSNGKFSFNVSADRKELLPADDFTKEWFTKTKLTLDAERNDTCNW